ncbi:hypothetical protein NQ314_021260 [Rhamnusium bicolor]|uniref:Aromatic amino acid beta-eliminating lyase/threonine aldolase domain-containing protein n=1 Tax=Rhamnusium bicolor TaxID=1586634 RepID=A0AAV8WIT3_9CUCU|nr:hypothetical protein NQ314_021260 [Rhamnusium bicolor]
MYEKIVNADLNGDVRIVDLRSDTISKPTQEMREAMYNAVVGDDVYGEDPMVLELQRQAAELVGKEDALFVASGTMANLISIMVHCSQRGSEIISGDNSHTFRFEQGGSAQIAGVQTALLKNNEDGTFSLDALRKKLGKILIFMNLLPPLLSLKIRTICVVVRATRTRKALGGGWRQAGILAAAGLVALDKMIDRLQEDHDHAYKIAKAIANLKSEIFKVDLKTVHTNIFMMYFDSSKFTAEDFLERIEEVRESDPIKVSVKAISCDSGCIRFVTYWEITVEDIDIAIKKILSVIRELENKFNE